MEQYDIVVIGAGPAGFCPVRSMLLYQAAGFSCSEELHSRQQTPARRSGNAISLTLVIPMISFLTTGITENF